MRNIIIITHECDECETEMEYRICDMTGENKIALFSLSQINFKCPECGLIHGTGDIEVLNENEW